jgi:hypothetical protein
MNRDNFRRLYGSYTGWEPPGGTARHRATRRDFNLYIIERLYKRIKLNDTRQ